ncbi:hypothetical protein PENDEC_c013G01371 [Penicillium decumbens]|uniref:Uncharacterized protein n=1 Tax=Penicillium decumbens TaxID=69771 RepID=A0A1V6P9W3_PENDC|nr:hypothetical protein PENDEC_c013G01371 [Penicillium decumbens]
MNWNPAKEKQKEGDEEEKKKKETGIYLGAQFGIELATSSTYKLAGGRKRGAYCSRKLDIPSPAAGEKLQAAWALLLGAYQGSDDVVYAMAVSVQSQIRWCLMV